MRLALRTRAPRGVTRWVPPLLFVALALVLFDPAAAAQQDQVSVRVEGAPKNFNQARHGGAGTIWLETVVDDDPVSAIRPNIDIVVTSRPT